MPIIGTHALLYTPEADAVRAVLRDVLELPPAEVGVHPTGTHPEDPASGTPHHELSFICDDINETVADLRARGVDVRGEPMNQGWGIAVMLALPGGLDVMLYEPRHATAI